MTTSHSGFLTRAESGSGSRSVLMSTSCAALISPSGRWSMKTGLPCHLTVSRWPTCTGPKSTSVVLSANVSLAGSMLSMSAHAGHRRCGDRQKIAPRRRIRGMRTHRLRLRRIRHRASLPYNLNRPGLPMGKAPARRPRGAGYRRRGTYTVERFRLCDILPHSRPLQPDIAGGCSPWCLPNRARARFPPAMRLALYEPDIPQNAGALLRLGACLGVAVDIIEPCGFVLGDRRLKRAGLDYLADVALTRHESWAGFRAVQRGRLVLLTTRAPLAYHRFAFRADDTLLLGRETAGVPDAVHQAANARLRVPMRPGLRSLNVALAAALVLGEALRQTGQFPTEPP